MELVAGLDSNGERRGVTLEEGTGVGPVHGGPEGNHIEGGHGELDAVLGDAQQIDIQSDGTRGVKACLDPAIDDAAIDVLEVALSSVADIEIVDQFG